MERSRPAASRSGDEGGAIVQRLSPLGNVSTDYDESTVAMSGNFAVAHVVLVLIKTALTVHLENKNASEHEFERHKFN